MYALIRTVLVLESREIKQNNSIPPTACDLLICPIASRRSAMAAAETTAENISQQTPAGEEEKEEEEESTTKGASEATTPAISKNQLKKQRKLAAALEQKAAKRQREREKRKLAGRQNKIVIQRCDGERVDATRKSLKKNLMAASKSRLRVVIDCSFEALMSVHDLAHLGKQLAYCYAANRRLVDPLQLYVTSVTSRLRESFYERQDVRNWDLHVSEQHFRELFAAEPGERVCYLTSDSPHTLERFDEHTVYVIGGLVDHNHHKSLCYNYAVGAGLSHARLPIDHYVAMKTRPVLTVNQVYDIVCKFVESRGDWSAALVQTLPARKGASVLAPLPSLSSPATSRPPSESEQTEARREATPDADDKHEEKETEVGKEEEDKASETKKRRECNE